MLAKNFWDRANNSKVQNFETIEKKRYGEKAGSFLNWNLPTALCWL